MRNTKTIKQNLRRLNKKPVFKRYLVILNPLGFTLHLSG